ncbi:unnamed protein product [Ceutorhynchus assimilis]|uniref:Uncharacterized protein n=1 Tax=Ceutorhynchus assimilis TaxID=467358 RepID=A0A9N9MXS0_9CUCU|nr:unnamed protein product [Ceutorhynchus assimilis]
MSEENNQKPTRKLIRVRKFRTNPTENNLEEQEVSAPTLSQNSDSIFSGDEEEIQVIDPESQSNSSRRHPIEFMFPHLKQEGLDTNNLTKTMSTTDLTKLLVGKTAQIPDEMRNRYGRRRAIDFSTIVEEDENSSSSEDLKKLRRKLRKLFKSPAEMTDDGNESDISESEEDTEDK